MLNVFNKKVLEMLEKIDPSTMPVLLENAELIHGLADSCREMPIFQSGYSTGVGTFKGLRADEIYNLLVYKIANCPMPALAPAIVILILPFVSDALKVAQAEEAQLSKELKTVSEVIDTLEAEEDKKNTDIKQALNTITEGE